MPLSLVKRPKDAVAHEDIFAAIEKADALMAAGKAIEARLWLRVVKKLAVAAKGAGR